MLVPVNAKSPKSKFLLFVAAMATSLSLVIPSGKAGPKCQAKIRPSYEKGKKHGHFFLSNLAERGFSLPSKMKKKKKK